MAINRAQDKPLGHGALPVFVISFNRGPFLQRAVDSYLRLARPVQIIIHDNGSDDPETIEVLDSLGSQGCLVYRKPPIAHADELNNVNETIRSFFADRSEATRYVVTDCDVDLSIARPDCLEVYDELLSVFPGIECVGPMLRIRDIPQHYPLYNRVMNRHIEQFWHRQPEWIDTARGPVASIECPIDTTFALHRAGEAFRRLRRARRVYYPYEALHLDWYHSAADYDAGPYSRTSCGNISHWNNKAALEEFGRAPLEFDRFIYVDDGPDKTLVAKTQFLQGQAPA